MTIKIKKLQEGGMAPFMVYTPDLPAQLAQQAASGSSGGTSKDSGKNKGILDDDIVKILMLEGIPSDVEQFMKLVSTLTDGIAEGADLSKIYLMLIPKITLIKTNKQRLNETVTLLNSNGGMNEIAITTNGGVVGQSLEDGSPVMLSLSEYQKNKDKYKLMTNNELARMRSYDSSAAFNNIIMSTLLNGLGTETVTKLIDLVIKELKVQKQVKQDFLPKETLNVIKGLEALTEGRGELTTTQESSRVHIPEAMSYLATMLPKQSMDLLRAKAVLMGLDPSTGVVEVLKNYIIPATMQSTTQDLTIKSDGGSGSGSGSGGVTGSEKMTWLMAYDSNALGVGRNGKMGTHSINLGDRYQINAPSLTLNGILDNKTLEMLPTFSSIETIANRGFGLLADVKNIYFGNQRISPDNLDRIVSNGKTMSKVYLPIDLEAFSKTGEIKPDLEIAQRISKAEDRIKTNNVTDPIEKAKIYSLFRIPDYSDANPENSPGMFAAFATIPAWAAEDGVLTEDADPRFLKKVDDTEQVREKLNEGKLGRKPNSNDKDYLSGWFDWLISKDIYEGLVFIHTPNDALASSQMSGGVNIPKSANTYDLILRNQANSDRQIRYQNAVSSTSALDYGRK